MATATSLNPAPVVDTNLSPAPVVDTMRYVGGRPWWLPDKYALILMSALPVVLGATLFLWPGSTAPMEHWWSEYYAHTTAWGLFKRFYVLLFCMYWGIGLAFFAVDLSGLLQKQKWQPDHPLDKSMLPKLFAKLSVSHPAGMTLRAHQVGTGWPLMAVGLLWLFGCDLEALDARISGVITAHAHLISKFVTITPNLPSYWELVRDSTVFFAVYEVTLSSRHRV